jgi:hypothetical protein
MSRFTFVAVFAAFIILSALASSCAHHEYNAAVASSPRPQSLETRRPKESAWRVSAVTVSWQGSNEPTVALRSAVWAATAVTAAAAVAVAAASDQANWSRRPRLTEPRRWEAGWAGQAGATGAAARAAGLGWAGHGQSTAAGRGGKLGVAGG